MIEGGPPGALPSMHVDPARLHDSALRSIKKGVKEPQMFHTITSVQVWIGSIQSQSNDGRTPTFCTAAPCRAPTTSGRPASITTIGSRSRPSASGQGGDSARWGDSPDCCECRRHVSMYSYAVRFTHTLYVSHDVISLLMTKYMKTEILPRRRVPCGALVFP